MLWNASELRSVTPGILDPKWFPRNQNCRSTLHFWRIKSSVTKTVTLRRSKLCPWRILISPISPFLSLNMFPWERRFLHTVLVTDKHSPQKIPQKFFFLSKSTVTPSQDRKLPESQERRENIVLHHSKLKSNPDKTETETDNKISHRSSIPLSFLAFSWYIFKNYALNNQK